MIKIVQLIRQVCQPTIFLLIFGTIFGLVFMVITPPLQVPDEYQHVYRAYAISEGVFFANQIELPAGIKSIVDETDYLKFHFERKIPAEMLLEFLRLPMDSGDEVKVIFPNVGVYTPLPYLASGLGSLTARIFNVSSGWYLLIVRFFNLTAWLGLTYWGLKIVPTYKWTFVFLLLSPMSLFMAMSSSADSLTIALSFFATAFCLRLAFGSSAPLTNKDILALILMTAIMSLVKPPYVLLMGLVLLIPLKRYQSTRHFIILIFLMGFVAILGQAFTALQFVSNHENYAFRGIDPQENLKFLLEYPLSVIIKIMRTSVDYRLYWKQFVGVLGWLDIPLRNWIYRSYFGVLILLAIVDGSRDIKISLVQKAIMTGVSALITFIILLFLFITWQPVYSGTIDGLQGRYLIPHATLIPLIFYNSKIKANRFIPILLGIYIALILGVTTHMIITRYYG